MSTSRSVLGVLLAVSLCTGCMNLAVAARPTNTSVSQAVVGGLLGDAVLAGVASGVTGRVDSDDTNTDPQYLWQYMVGLIAVDAAVLAARLVMKEK